MGTKGPFGICFYCICRRARVGLRRIIYPFRRITAHASRNSAHDGEGERKRRLGMGFHRVNYTISAALCVGFRGRFPWPRKVSVVRREQIRVLNQNRRSLSTFQPFNFSTFQPFNFSTCLTAAQTAAHPIMRCANTRKWCADAQNCRARSRDCRRDFPRQAWSPAAPICMLNQRAAIPGPNTPRTLA